MKIVFTSVVALSISLASVAQMPLTVTSKTNVYAGLEVGSKGVKLSILEVSKNSSQPGSYRLIKDTSINTNFVNFEKTSSDNTLKAFTGLYKYANTISEIKSENIFTVISSGVKGQADRLGKNQEIDNLISSFKNDIKEPKRDVAIIDVFEESRLSHLGIVPNERRFSTFLIDIGSGNTKGGYFPNGNTNEMKMFNLNWGTKSIANETDKRSGEDKTMLNYSKNVKRVLNSSVNDEIVYAVNSSNAYAMSDYIAMSGGICWSIATLMYPELTNHSVIPVSYDDIAEFVNKVNVSTQPFDVATLDKVLKQPQAEKEVILGEVKKVHAAFDQKSLVAGSSLLLQIMRQFSGVQDKKLFYLVKNGQVGWISAYVDMKRK